MLPSSLAISSKLKNIVQICHLQIFTHQNDHFFQLALSHNQLEIEIKLLKEKFKRMAHFCHAKTLCYRQQKKSGIMNLQMSDFQPFEDFHIFNSISYCIIQ